MEQFLIDVFSRSFGPAIIAISFGYYLIPKKQRKEKLESELCEFHEKYFNLMDCLLDSRLRLVRSYDKCKSTYTSLEKQLNDEIGSKKPEHNEKTMNYYLEFREDRKSFLDAKTCYIKNLATFLNLFYEEQRLMNQNLNNPEVVSQILLWLYSSNEEMKDCFKFLDEISETSLSGQISETTYSSNYQELKIDQYFIDIISSSLNINCPISKVKSYISRLPKDCHWYNDNWENRKESISNCKIVDYQDAKKIFHTELNINRIDHNFRPFWITLETYTKLEQVRYEKYKQVHEPKVSKTN